ncbi:MAG: glycosyltransferase [Candidatus Marinimicrobia bacterium]|nr:glycosyltransferase [Candidatus Neomarinimicrobiota bacterium]
MSTSVCHIASNHPRTDVRIFVKEISSLKEAGFDVSLVVADGMKDDERNKIFDAGKVSGRFRRLLLLRKLYKKAAALQCELYHFHDPELIPVAFRLKKDGKKVIYDIHEDLPRQLLSKPYIPAVFRKPLSRLLEKYENRRSKKFDALLTSTDHIKSRFSTFHPRVEAVKNYPRIEEFRETGTTARDEGTFSLLYIGALMEVRGVREMLQAVSGLPVTLNIAGFFPEKSFEEEILRDPLWSGSGTTDI